jgi:thiamine monophosphate kinase
MDHYVAASENVITVIGEVTAAEYPGVRVVDGAGKEMELARGGWDHFAPI